MTTRSQFAFQNRLAVQAFLKNRAGKYMHELFKEIDTVRWHRYIEYKYRGNL